MKWQSHVHEIVQPVLSPSFVNSWKLKISFVNSWKSKISFVNSFLEPPWEGIIGTRRRRFFDNFIPNRSYTPSTSQINFDPFDDRWRKWNNVRVMIHLNCLVNKTSNRFLIGYPGISPASKNAMRSRLKIHNMRLWKIIFARSQPILSLRKWFGVEFFQF